MYIETKYQDEYQFRNFLLIDKGRQSGEFSFVYIEDNKFLGYGYYELNHQIKTKDQIESRLIPIEENLDTQISSADWIQLYRKQ